MAGTFFTSSLTDVSVALLADLSHVSWMETGLLSGIVKRARRCVVWCDLYPCIACAKQDRSIRDRAVSSNGEM